MAAETAKQIITLASALLAFTVTFAKEFQVLNTASVPGQLKVSWVLLVFTVAMAVWTLMAITGSIHEAERGGAAGAFDWNIKVPATLMIFGFFGALSLMVSAGWTIST